MRVLNLEETHLVGGSGVTVTGDGSYSATAGTMVEQPDGSYTIDTNDGWMVIGDGAGGFQIFAPDGNEYYSWEGN